SLNSFHRLMGAAPSRGVVHSAPMIRQIAVIGTGTMGRGIAYLAAVAGYDTVVHDVDVAALDAARASVESTLRKGVEKGKVSEAAAGEALARVHLEQELEPAVHG